MSHTNQIKEMFGCASEYAEKVVENMSGIGFDFSNSTQDEFNATAVEIFQLMESGVL